jgi:cell division protein FtsI (penicillin-binding protein 3)
MTRRPLRPLAQILAARIKGQDPDAIELENLRQRHEATRDSDRERAEGRLLVIGIFFLCAFFLVAGRMGVIAASDVAEPRAQVSSATILAQRADIVDRNGRILATNLTTHSLYAQPPIMIDPERAARELAKIFPELDHAELSRDFTGARKFLWIKKKISPEQKQAVHDIGEPGLQFGPREMRLYPNGSLAAHVLGGAGFGREGTHSAELVGVAGVERVYDAYLRDPAHGGAALELSLDLSVQAATERVLLGGMKLMNARGAAAVLMDARTGEILSLVSLPDFDPNDRPVPLTEGDAADSPLFNRAVQGVYELGSTFKIFAVAQAIELGLVNTATQIETKGPLRWGRHRIRDLGDNGPSLSVADVIVKSSNIGTARVAQMIGPERQQTFLRSLGLFDPLPVELSEASTSRPLLPPKWSEISTMTVSYGHGLSASPLHLASAYATLLNGGRKVAPTLMRDQQIGPKPQMLSARTSQTARHLLRRVVEEGSATLGNVEGYHVAGKTGTADKPNPEGGYHEDRVIATFAAVFPETNPAYVLVVTLDEPVETSGKKPRRMAGWTAVPVAAEIIRRTAPLLGLAPDIDHPDRSRVKLASNQSQ